MREIFYSKNNEENNGGRLKTLFFIKALNNVKASGLQPDFTIF